MHKPDKLTTTDGEIVKVFQNEDVTWNFTFIDPVTHEPKNLAAFTTLKVSFKRRFDDPATKELNFAATVAFLTTGVDGKLKVTLKPDTIGKDILVEINDFTGGKKTVLLQGRFDVLESVRLTA